MHASRIFEELVTLKLLKRPHVFLRPQHSIDRSWSYADFVAIDLKNRTVSIVEVSTD